MVKVRILKSRAGLTAASAVMALSSLGGCTADDADQDPGIGTDDSTESVAGAGQLLLHGWTVNYQSTSGGDEFVRVGEKMKFSSDYAHLVELAVRFESPEILKALLEDPSKVKLEAAHSYKKGEGGIIAEARVPMSVGPGPAGQRVATSEEWVIPKGVRELGVEVYATYDKDGAPVTVNILGKNGVYRKNVMVFGAYLPNKLALFDTMGSERRARIVEGGALVRGARALLAYSDWRLDTVSDKATMDLYVGQARNYSRFGPAIVDAFGTVEYEVTAAVSTDDGNGWHDVFFGKKDGSVALAGADGLRYALEADLGIPTNATGLRIAFHVKAFLVVPKDREIVSPKYPGQSRILLKDFWDNNGGKDYRLPIGAR
jgi:hypothetical protein